MKCFKIITHFALISVLLGLVSLSYAAEEDATKVAKVIILRGKAKAKAPTEQAIVLKKGDWVKEGSIIQTSKKSFVKLLFIDKSQMNLGPKSKMVINKFPRKKAGIITLMKGQLRSKVTKDYLDIKDKDKSKLFIKTKTAAMGVRGTDFEVNHSPTSGVTNLDVISGAVVMAKIEGGIAIDQDILENLVSSDNAVMVTKGNQSSVSPGSGAAAPNKIPKGKMIKLKKSSDSEVSATRHIPPGVKKAVTKNNAAGKSLKNREPASVGGQGKPSVAAAGGGGVNFSPNAGGEPNLDFKVLEETFDEEMKENEEAEFVFDPNDDADTEEIIDEIVENSDIREIDPCGQGQCDPGSTNVNFDFNVQ